MAFFVIYHSFIGHCFPYHWYFYDIVFRASMCLCILHCGLCPLQFYSGLRERHTNYLCVIVVILTR